MATVKKGWTAETTAALVEAYEAGTTLETLAVEMDKSVASLRAKLVSLGKYTTAAKATAKAAGGKATKAEVAEQIRTKVQGELVGLETLTMATLVELLASLPTATSEEIPEDSE